MRYNQSTLKASTVHAYARHLLVQTLELEHYQPALPLRLVASVLLLAACCRVSLTLACSLVHDRPSHHRVRAALAACLPPRPRDLLERLRRALRQTLPDHLGRVPRVMALDLHQRPYWGQKTTRGVTLRQKKAGTRKSFTYATLAVLDGPERFTVGLLPTRPTMRLTTVVERLLGQAEDFGLPVQYLMMDKDFYAAEVFALLQRRGVAFLTPAQKRGGKAGGGNQHLYRPDCPVGWYEYTWTTPQRRRDFRTGKRPRRGTLTVTVRMCVARPAGKEKALVYATGGLLGWSPAQVARAYRRRFGIEAKYRQLGQCLARTSARGEQLRLLLVGLALVLGNLWALLHSEVFSRGPLGERQWRLAALRLAALIAAVAATIAAAFGGWVCVWPTQRSLPAFLMAYTET
jgi:Transposase DDE domain